MSIEELKLVLEVVKSVSDGALAVAVTWLILNTVLPTLAWLLVGLGAYKLAEKVFPYVGHAPLS